MVFDFDSAIVLNAIITDYVENGNLNKVEEIFTQQEQEDPNCPPPVQAARFPYPDPFRTWAEDILFRIAAAQTGKGASARPESRQGSGRRILHRYSAAFSHNTAYLQPFLWFFTSILTVADRRSRSGPAR